MKEIEYYSSPPPSLPSPWGNFGGEGSPHLPSEISFARNTGFVIREGVGQAAPGSDPLRSSWLPLVLCAFAHVFHSMGDSWTSKG